MKGREALAQRAESRVGIYVLTVRFPPRPLQNTIHLSVLNITVFYKCHFMMYFRVLANRVDTEGHEQTPLQS